MPEMLHVNFHRGRVRMRSVFLSWLCTLLFVDSLRDAGPILCLQLGDILVQHSTLWVVWRKSKQNKRKYGEWSFSLFFIRFPQFYMYVCVCVCSIQFYHVCSLCIHQYRQYPQQYPLL